MEFHLKQKDKLLGTLRSYDLDFPWLLCKFEFTEAFQQIKPLFDEESKLLESDDMEKWEVAYSKIDNLNLELINLEDEKSISDFLLHIQDDEAWIRY